MKIVFKNIISICVAASLLSTGFVGAMESSPNSSMPCEADLETPFAQLLKQHGWTVELVDYNIISPDAEDIQAKDGGEILWFSTNLLNMIAYRSPKYSIGKLVPENKIGLFAITFSAKIGLHNKIYFEKGSTKGWGKWLEVDGQIRPLDDLNGLATCLQAKSLVLTESEKKIRDAILSPLHEGPRRLWKRDFVEAAAFGVCGGLTVACLGALYRAYGW